MLEHVVEKIGGLVEDIRTGEQEVKKAYLFHVPSVDYLLNEKLKFFAAHLIQVILLAVVHNVDHLILEIFGIQLALFEEEFIVFFFVYQSSYKLMQQVPGFV